MTDKKGKSEALKPKADKGFEPKPGKAANNPEKASLVNDDSDTEPDEFISPKADTDEPIDGQVLNDAVLRGEPHDSKITNLPPDDKQQ